MFESRGTGYHRIFSPRTKNTFDITVIIYVSIIIRTCIKASMSYRVQNQHIHLLYTAYYPLTHLSLDKMVAISQATFSNTFLWTKSSVFRFKFHGSLFLRVQLTVNSCYGLASSPYLNQGWSSSPTHICGTTVSSQQDVYLHIVSTRIIPIKPNNIWKYSTQIEQNSIATDEKYSISP